jgi:hypothetical protein
MKTEEVVLKNTVSAVKKELTQENAVLYYG